MNRRISFLVASGFVLVLGLGVLVSGIMMTGLQETVARSQASAASALEVRAGVRSLRADYLESGDAVSRLMLDPTQQAPLVTKRQADANAEKHLTSAQAASRSPELRALLERLHAHDRAITNRIEGKLLALAAVDARKAKRLYFAEYLPARGSNVTLVEQALKLASEEVAQAVALTEAEARQTFVLGWSALGLFVVVGTMSSILLSRAVRGIALRFEQTAAEVREQRDHLQGVMTAMRDSLIVADADGTIAQVNDATCTLLGWERDALVGQPLDRCATRESATGSEPTATYVARDGSHIPMAVSVANLHDASGRETGTVWVGHDMREHLRMLAEVAAARDAALEGSRSKSEFLANMSHEIRTPMNVVIGYTDILLESQLPPDHREYLDRVRLSAVNLLDIINDVLDISKVEAGKLTIQRVEYRVRNVVQEVLRTLVLRAQDKGLALSLDVAADVPERVTGDPTRLRQVVLNLVSNAIKFTERGAVAVTVAVEPPAPDAPPDDEPVLHYQVRDTGIGIPAEKQAMIFQAFTQADGSMSRRFEGTGLGLTIAARLVEMMGGRIWVESAAGTGSVFHFTVGRTSAAHEIAA